MVTSRCARTLVVVGRTSPYERGTWRSSARDSPGVATALVRLGRRIRSLRTVAELTQEQAAERSKLDVKHWQDIEAGRTNPTVATLHGIAKAVGVKLAELFET